MKKLKKTIIPIAGLGTRMLPATKAIPKEALLRADTEFDWVARIFLIFLRNLYEPLGGFDCKYFMYFENFQLFYKSKKSGIIYPFSKTIKVIHDARQPSKKKFFYFLIYLKSAIRFFSKNKKIT